MSFLEAILLGLIQGFTEFIPVSSTAHIVILAQIIGLQTPGLTFEIFLHIASLLAVIVYFRNDLVKLVLGALRCVPGLLNKDLVKLVIALIFGDLRRTEVRGTSLDDRVCFRFACLIVGATGITGVLGILLMKTAGDALKTPPVVGGALLLTAICLIAVEQFGKRISAGRGDEQMTFWDGVVVGLAQTIAVTPGISRSGATLIAGLAMGLNRDTAVRFSFLLAIPVLLGSSLLAVKDIATGELGLGAAALAVSFAVSFVASMVSIVFLIRLLKSQRLYWFSIYLVGLAVYTFFFLAPESLEETGPVETLAEHTSGVVLEPTLEDLGVDAPEIR